MLALYLDIQKQLAFDGLTEREVKGRWRSFVSKWNRGELAEGWYDPATKEKALASVSEEYAEYPHPRGQSPPDYGPVPREQSIHGHGDDGQYGPAPPPNPERSSKAGPAIPTFQDLEMRKEQAVEDSLAYREHLRYARARDRKLQKERLEALVPRAEPGSRERQLEKKREKADQSRSFRENKSPGAEEQGDADVLGDGGLEDYKAKKGEMERKKNEREIRREEMLRARAAEREERLTVHRVKEEKTVEMLKALAKERFG